MILKLKQLSKLQNHYCKSKLFSILKSHLFGLLVGTSIYCDNRISLSHSEVRTFYTPTFTGIISRYGKPDVIAGVATGAIAHGVLVELGLPFIYVRASAKEHGRKNLIEGNVESGQSVVVIEDLISSGKSSLAVVKALRDADFKVMAWALYLAMALNTLKKAFEEVNCELFTLGDYDTLIGSSVRETKYINKEDFEILKVWREDLQYGINEFNRKSSLLLSINLTKKF